MEYNMLSILNQIAKYYITIDKVFTDVDKDPNAMTIDFRVDDLV